MGPGPHTYLTLLHRPDPSELLPGADPDPLPANGAFPHRSPHFEASGSGSALYLFCTILFYNPLLPPILSTLFLPFQILS